MGFKKGDRVIATCSVGHKNMANAIGTILYIKNTGRPVVEFDKYIDGHDGGDYEIGTNNHIEGKDGYCWFMSFDDLKPLNINKRIA